MTGLIADRQRRTLVDLLRVAFPHDNFPLGAYERTAQAVLDKAAGDPRLHGLLVQGLSDVDEEREVPFSELPAATAALVLRGLDRTPFLTGIVDVAVVALYDDHEVWEILGYEGASFDKGGYIDRGFDDLDWLPDPSIDNEVA
ncbi:hypothetical protein [Pseudonocardia sp. N23]|uniref:hypothetical protein n=1 Tax=Pseudonocardia sp. N23 TaxID=1987376 RepID=UPI000BFD645A|nr:hypothetical protein [Pseudonocardia sp. N23]GAY08066.1 Tat pathway signal sequence domain protein [Pseudonocardia sp. N23]